MQKLAKILNIVLAILLALSVVVAIMFYTGGEVAGAAYYTPVFTNLIINWGILLLIIAAAAALIFSIVNIVMNPKNAVKTLISVGILAVIVLISYSFADDTVLTMASGADVPDNIPSRLKFADTVLNSMYILFGLAILSIVYTEVSRVFK